MGGGGPREDAGSTSSALEDPVQMRSLPILKESLENKAGQPVINCHTAHSHCFASSRNRGTAGTRDPPD